MGLFEKALEETKAKDDDIIIRYLINNTDYTRFESYDEFEEYRRHNSLDEALRQMTEFDDEDEMLRRGRKEIIPRIYDSDKSY